MESCYLLSIFNNYFIWIYTLSFVWATINSWLFWFGDDSIGLLSSGCFAMSKSISLFISFSFIFLNQIKWIIWCFWSPFGRTISSILFYLCTIMIILFICLFKYYLIHFYIFSRSGVINKIIFGLSSIICSSKHLYV